MAPTMNATPMDTPMPTAAPVERPLLDEGDGRLVLLMLGSVADDKEEDVIWFVDDQVVVAVGPADWVEVRYV